MKHQALLLLLGLCFYSCKKTSEDAQAPSLEFLNFEYVAKTSDGKDSLILARFSFKDVNGDIGRRDNEFYDNCGRQQKDLHMLYEVYSNNQFKPLLLPVKDTIFDGSCNIVQIKDSVQLDYYQTLQYVEPQGNNKSIEGIIEYKLTYLSELITLPPRGRFLVYMKDRAGNKSNEVYTTDFIISK